MTRRLPLLLLLAGCDVFSYDVFRLAGERLESSDAPAGTDRVRIPGGVANIGCQATVDEGCLDHERPLHTVILPTYEIDRTEVTQAAYGRCVEAGTCALPACTWDEENAPVACVTWQQASQYCAWAGGRLPTEAEWERAARADERKYPWGNDFPGCERAAFAQCGLSQPALAGALIAGAATNYVLDLAGNVAEWVSDWYAWDAYSSSESVNPQGPPEGTVKVIRGGSFASPAGDLRSSARAFLLPNDAQQWVGFRCARTVPPSEEPAEP